MILAYRILTNLIYPLLFIFIFLRIILKKEDPKRYKEKIFISHFNVNRKKDSKLIWFHAASIGELKSIIPIIEELNTSRKNLEFLVTTTTLSSANLATEVLEKFNNTQHRFFPFDINFLIDKFLSLWKPSAIFLVDSEIWPNLIFNASKKRIPIAVINARITEKTFKKWMIFPKTAKKIFGSLNLFLTSNLESRDYLRQFNAKNIYFTGNIKLINKIDTNNIKNINKKILLSKKFWLAASTHNGEELLCLQTHFEIKKKYKDLITIIAPRHINRVQSIKKLCEDKNLNVQILNKDEIILEDKEIIIINSFGILQNYFKYAKSIFIGKSTLKRLEKVGGQNPIDAVKLGCKVYHGPFVYNFKEIYKILKENNIYKEITNSTELSDNLIEDLNYFHKKDHQISVLINKLGQKTLAGTMKKINDFLFNEVN